MAFGQCTSLKSISLSGNISSIASNAFEGCDYLDIIASEYSYAHGWAVSHYLEYEEPVLESPHPVLTDDIDESYSYTGNSDAAALRVTFSHRSKLDYLTMKDAAGGDHCYYDGRWGIPMIIAEGNAFTIALAQEGIGSYGFRITSIVPMSADEYATWFDDNSTLYPGTMVGP